MLKDGLCISCVCKSCLREFVFLFRFTLLYIRSKNTLDYFALGHIFYFVNLDFKITLNCSTRRFAMALHNVRINPLIKTSNILIINFVLLTILKKIRR